MWKTQEEVLVIDFHSSHPSGQIRKEREREEVRKARFSWVGHGSMMQYIKEAARPLKKISLALWLLESEDLGSKINSQLLLAYLLQEKCQSVRRIIWELISLIISVTWLKLRSLLGSWVFGCADIILCLTSLCRELAQRTNEKGL